MRAIQVNSDSPLFVPHYVADSVLDIDFKLLKQKGIDYVAFDADSTLVRSRGKRMEDKTQQFLHRELKIFKGVCIASNRVTNDLDVIGRELDAEIIRASLTKRKPSLKFFDRVIDYFQAKPKTIAMVGDKLIADIYGGNRAGLVTVWVKKNGRDNVLDQVFQTRRFERYMVRHHLGNQRTRR